MKHINNKLLFLSLAFLTLANIAVFAKADELGSRRWELVELNGRAVGRTNAFIEINDNLRRFSGNTGCNQIFGGVAVIGKRIEFSKIGTTKMACRDRNMNRNETVLIQALEEARRYRQAGNSLELLDRNRVVAKFSAARENDEQGLDDRKWVLESIAGRRTFKALPYAFLNFDAKKQSVGGDTSCNVFGGEYKASGKRIAITDIVSTMRACVEDERMDVERAFLDGLRKADRFEIENGRLMLYNNKKLLLTFRGESK